MSLGNMNESQKTKPSIRVERSISQGISRRPRNHEILGERAFTRLLSLERKRAERSRKQFALALIDAKGATQASRAESVLQTVISSLASATRETDIIGWYEDCVVGIIFTEIGGVESGSFTTTLVEKINSALQSILPSESELFAKIDVSLHLYPASWHEQHLDNLADLKLYPDLRMQKGSQLLSKVLKRVIDVTGSLLALILCSPLFLIISILIKLTSKGPVLFQQERIGQFGKRFQLLKFRSMYEGNDPGIHKEYVRKLIAGKVNVGQANGQQDSVYKLTRDPRITPAGRLLRKTSLDELPQFWNVLKGDMSLVGPRPPILYEVISYEVWHRPRVLEVKPGITGLWQVTRRSKATFNEMVRLDLEYGRTWSLGLDIEILLRTPWAVLSRKGAH